MKKILGFMVTAGVLVAAGIWFMDKNPEFFQSVIDWVQTEMGMK